MTLAAARTLGADAVRAALDSLLPEATPASPGSRVRSIWPAA
jgi:hypothetical protein